MSKSLIHTVHTNCHSSNHVNIPDTHCRNKESSSKWITVWWSNANKWEKDKTQRQIIIFHSKFRQSIKTDFLQRRQISNVFAFQGRDSQNFLCQIRKNFVTLGSNILTLKKSKSVFWTKYQLRLMLYTFKMMKYLSSKMYAEGGTLLYDQLGLN